MVNGTDTPLDVQLTEVGVHPEGCLHCGPEWYLFGLAAFLFEGLDTSSGKTSSHASFRLQEKTWNRVTSQVRVSLRVSVAPRLASCALTNAESVLPAKHNEEVCSYHKKGGG